MKAQTILQKAKRLVKESGMTYQEVGERMSYPPKSARQSTYQFLHSTNPSAAMLLRFCEAMEINVKELFEG